MNLVENQSEAWWVLWAFAEECRRWEASADIIYPLPAACCLTYDYD